MRSTVRATMRQAYSCSNVVHARKQLQNLVRTLRAEHPSAASSLEEGLEETHRSTDDGQTFQDMGPFNVEGLLIDGASVWAATDAQGIFKSTDGGLTWTRHPSPNYYGWNALAG